MKFSIETIISVILSFAAGFVLATLISIDKQYKLTNDWSNFCSDLNNEWAEYCKKQQKHWADFCHYLINKDENEVQK